MSPVLDTKPFYGKLARCEALTETEIVDLLKAVEHFQQAAAYLASCQAATLEGLPKSASKSARVRHETICRVAAELLAGDSRSIRYPTTAAHAQARCEAAVAASSVVGKTPA